MRSENRLVTPFLLSLCLGGGFHPPGGDLPRRGVVSGGLGSGGEGGVWGGADGGGGRIFFPKIPTPGRATALGNNSRGLCPKVFPWADLNSEEKFPTIGGGSILKTFWCTPLPSTPEGCCGPKRPSFGHFHVFYIATNPLNTWGNRPGGCARYGSGTPQ